MKNIIIGAIAAVVLLGGGFYAGLFSQPAQAPTTDNVQPGAVVGPDVQGNQWSVGSLVQWEYHIAMRPNASTTCQFISPGATSTLASLTAKISSSTTGANIVEFGTSVGGFATTTLYGTTYNVAAGAQASIVASTSPTTGNPVLGPNTKISVKVGNYGATAPQGTCNVKFNVL